jgi:hypothetical protein
LGLPAPAGAVRLPCGRPTEPSSDPIGIATLPAREIRPGWVLSILRGYGAHTAGAGNPAAAGRLATAHPWTWVPLPPPQAWHNGASSRVHSRSPVRSSPLPVAPRVEREPLGVSSGLHTPPLPAAHAGVGTGIGHLPGITSPAPTGPPVNASTHRTDLRVARPPSHHPPGRSRRG